MRDDWWTIAAASLGVAALVAGWGIVMGLGVLARSSFAMPQQLTGGVMETVLGRFIIEAAALQPETLTAREVRLRAVLERLATRGAPIERAIAAEALRVEGWL